MRRVAVTGFGAVSACGPSAADLWKSALNGRSAVRDVVFPRIHRQSVGHAAKISDEVMKDLLANYKPRFQDPVAMLALAAAREAVAHAGLSADDFGARCAVIVGSGFGGAATIDQNYSRFSDDPGARIDPMSVPKIMTNSPASWIAMDWKVTGPTYCISTACSSASQSLGMAAYLIRSGIVDRCIAGGAEALLVDGAFAAWEALHVISNTACRPFSAGRNGMVLGEGAGIVILESFEAAEKRGATVLAELAGYGSTSDASDLLRPDVAGARSCIQMAIADSGLPLDDIGYVNAHGTGTIANDVTEAQALRDVFGKGFDPLLISSTKPIHGHALGASGALEFIIAVCALREQIAPPTINFTGVDPKVGFEPVPNEARPFSSRAAISNSFAFGGINASLVLTRPDDC
jgi:nodulation protein E